MDAADTKIESGSRRLTTYQTRPTQRQLRNASCSVFGRTVALVRLFTFLLCGFSVTFNVEVARAQEQSSELTQSVEVSTRFRVERTAIASGGELLTIWAQIVGGSEKGTPREESQDDQTEEIPLLSVLRDTLGDANRENDVRGEVWVHTYASPKLIQ